MRVQEIILAKSEKDVSFADPTVTDNEQLYQMVVALLFRHNNNSYDLIMLSLSKYVKSLDGLSGPCVMGHAHEIAIKIEFFAFPHYFYVVLQICCHFIESVLSAFQFLLLAHFLH